MAKIPTEIFRTKYEIKKSNFIGFGYPINSPEDARKILKELKKEFSDARHHCYAFVWGENSTHMGMSDDGEPNGTAGRPMLEVLKGSGYENTLIIAVRYFGGIKLGTGGLVKAYTEITKMVIKDIPVKEYIEESIYTLTIPYTIYDAIKRIFTEFSCSITAEEFLVDIKLTIKAPTSNENILRESIKELSNGSVLLTRI
ncbi:MAG: YigZ family protein [Spirochaetaceae bacterium 4572_7]|nr:MAG: YigZ family protein [Spirochaetaceae bacterium 4572_7]